MTEGDPARRAPARPWWARFRRTARAVATPTETSIDRTSAAPRQITPAQCRAFAAQGVLILPGFFDQAAVEPVRARLDAMWAQRPANVQIPIDIRLGEPRERRRDFRLTDAADRAAPYKISDLHFHEPAVQALSADPRLLGVIEDLLSAPPVVMHSILLEYGSQQSAHFDTFYMPSPTPNLMAAAWIALDPVTQDNGPLFYYPGSHLIPPYRFSDGGTKAIEAEYAGAAAHIARVTGAHGLRRQEFLAQPGDVLIWHAQLLHGGGAIADPRQTRLSLVTHYWTTVDVADAERLIELGNGRKLLRKPMVTVDADELDAFLASLATAPADRASVPPGFDARRYLLANPDVFFSRTDPYAHFRYFGQAESREW